MPRYVLHLRNGAPIEVDPSLLEDDDAPIEEQVSGGGQLGDFVSVVDARTLGHQEWDRLAALARTVH